MLILPRAFTALRRKVSSSTCFNLIGETAMATFIVLANFTDQGIRSIKDSPKRAEAFRAAASKSGVTVKDICWTVGKYDMLTIVEGSEEACMALGLQVAALGNVRTETLRAFSASEFSKILSHLP
jgi:uncharacterized protein with GYD domain